MWDTARVKIGMMIMGAITWRDLILAAILVIVVLILLGVGVTPGSVW